MSFTRAITKEPRQKLYLQSSCDEMESSSLETTVVSHLEKKKFLRGLQVPGSCWMLRGCRDYAAQGRLCHWQSSSSSSSMNSGEWERREGAVAVAVAAPPPSAAGREHQPSPGWGLTWRHGVCTEGGGGLVREGERQRAGRGRKIQWIAKLPPNQ